MARTSRGGAPAQSFDALDNIDIDDMFADDALFDGMELGLEPMGDIADLGNAAVESQAAAAGEEISESNAASAGEDVPKRRKTKRKLKPTILDGDEDESNEPPSKKKRRTAKPITTKKKGTKKEEPKPELPKTKSKVKSIVTPVPIQRAASLTSTSTGTMSQGNVAAAGQFGGRQKRGQFALPLSRSTSDKLKTKASKVSLKPSTSAVIAPASGSSGEKKKQKKTTSTPVTAPISAPVPASAPEKTALFVPPYPHTIFCGLEESSTVFYPFMPALPPEPSVKNRKQYPVIDRIHSSFTSNINATTNVPKGTNSAGLESIYQLMHDTITKDATTPTGQANSADTLDQKEAAICNAIVSMRKTVAGMDKPKLASDLFSVCHLLNRQYDFLQQNLANMEKWCKNNFSEAEYSQTYGAPDGTKKLKETAAVESIFANFKTPLVKVKIKCSNFREPKLSGPMFAFLPRHLVGGLLPLPEQIKEKKVVKKRKSSTMDPSTMATAKTTPPVATPDKEDMWKTYSTLRPSKRRQVIADDVALTAKELEASCISRTLSRCQAIERRHFELKKLVEEDEVAVIHSAAMWEYADKAGYFSGFTGESLNDTLRSVWSPAVRFDLARDVTSSSLPSFSRMQNRDRGAKSLFDGLQSLLVEEDDGVDEDEDDVNVFREDFDEVYPPKDSIVSSSIKLVDLSGLSLDERAYTHLRKAGLLEDSQVQDSWLGNVSSSSDVAGELEGFIKRMSIDLLRISSNNNARTSFIEAVATTFHSRSKTAALKAAEESSSIAKCQQLLKRKNDIKLKSSRPMVGSNEEYALPW
jgi:hypothetical protein